MTIKVNPNTCPKCGVTIPSDAPQGLCPKCVLQGAATTDDAISPAATAELPSLERVAAAFPQLEILELLGRGGMGFVFKARQPNLDRLVALKLLPDKLARDPHFAERFGREARVLAKLNHPGIVTIYDFGQAGGFYFLLMEYVDGVNMRQAMQAGKFSPAAALAVVPKICEALQFAHEQGVLHRDIKPANILLDAKGRVKIADFGIAKLVGDEKPDFNLTATGAAIGTPQYMSPEQLEKPGTVDHRADIYSLGVVFYEMLTGELPIGRFSPPSQRTPVDPRVDEVVMRTLEKEREKRYQSAGEVKTNIEHLTEVGAGDFPGATTPAAAGPKQGPHGTMLIQPSTLRSKLDLGNRRGVLKWAFLLLMAGALGYLVLPNRGRNQANERNPSEGASAKLQGAPLDVTNTVPRMRFTFTAVETREVAGKRWLAIDYLDSVQGDCQKAFPWETKIPGFLAEVRTSEFLKENTDAPAVRHQRVEYLMPDSMQRAQLEQLRGEVERALKQKTILLQLGEQKVLFEFGSSSDAAFKAWIKVMPLVKASPVSDAPHTSPFAPTRWTLVLRARGESAEGRAALSELCEAYYQPVLRFLRREGRDEDAARELTHDFFARVLAGGAFNGADPERGRFRSYLLGALKHFLADQRAHAQRLKRGGGIAPDSLDARDETDTSPSLQVADATATSPGAFFDREWALTIMDRALAVLQKEFAEAGKANQFDILKPWLMGDASALSQAGAASRLDLSEGAVKVTIHRLRKRFREVVRSEVAQTLRDPKLVDEELHHLVEALA